MSSRQIRPATLSGSDADYTARAEIERASGRSTTVADLKHEDSARDPKHRRNVLLAEVDGVVVATGLYAEWPWWYEEGRYLMELYVHPAHRQQGHGLALYAAMREYLANENPAGTIFMCKCADNQPQSIRFVRARGFQQVGHDFHSELDVNDFELARFEPAERQLQEQGIEIVSYHELVARDPDFLRNFYELSCLTMLDVPSGGERTFPPIEQFERTRIQHPTFKPEFFYMALHNGRYVGQSDLANADSRERLGTNYTGVDPAYRRRGIATLLKAHCIQRAKEEGYKTIATDNDSRNPMVQVNLQLGFKPMPGDLLFEMRVG